MVPVILLNVLENGLVIAPVNVRIFLFPSLGDFLKLFESMSDQVLIKRDTLRKLLKNLVSGGKFCFTVYIEGERWCERLWRNYFDTAVRLSILVVVQTLDIINWI